MKKTILTCILLPLLAMKCYQKEGPNCHHNITFRNRSDFTLLLGELYKNYDGKCALYFVEFKPGEEYIKIEDNCWENAPPFEVYIVSPEQFSHGEYYNCDSIEIKNKVLKRYMITQDYLQQNNWTVNYPE